MCFSPEADLLAAVVVGGIGIDAVRHVRRSAELPLAAIPLVLAAHSLIEVFVWLGLQDRTPEAVGRAALLLYLVIAFGVLPVLVPVAVGGLEPVSGRARAHVFTAIGIGVAVVLMYTVVRGPIDAGIEGHHIAYSVDLWHATVIIALYIAATCGSMLLSRHAHVRWYGAGNLAAAGSLAWLDQSGFVSLWCVWAAVTSGAIAVHLRRAHRPPAPAVAGAGTGAGQPGSG